MKVDKGSEFVAHGVKPRLSPPRENLQPRPCRAQAQFFEKFRRIEYGKSVSTRAARHGNIPRGVNDDASPLVNFHV